MSANVRHGGTDAGPTARVDFSTNANALGPDPHVLAALRGVDPTAYPDPAYTRLREELAAHHGVTPGQVVVGAGASELIARVTAEEAGGGRVLVWRPTFGEYAHAAGVAGARLVQAADPAAWLAALAHVDLAFLCQPNSPDGRVHEPAFAHAVADRAAATGTRVVVDLAYAPLTEGAVTVPAGCWQLHSPNKAHGLTGVRAAYLLVPDAGRAARLRDRAHSWVLSAHGEAFLAATLTDTAREWLAGTRPQLWRWRDELATALRARGFFVPPTRTNFLLAGVGGTDGSGRTPGVTGMTGVAAALGRAGVRVRHAGSFGLPGHLRLRAHTPPATRTLLAALDDLHATVPPTG